MNDFRLNYVIMTSTRGHFNRHDIVKDTVADIYYKHSSFTTSFYAKYANIKCSTDSAEYLSDIKDFLLSHGINTNVTHGDWNHNSQSHQNGYLSDLFEIFRREDVNEAEYTLLTEDDFKIRCAKKDFSYWIEKSVALLMNNPNYVQVRIPRFNNEFERINKLKAKHGIDAQAIKSGEDSYFEANDWSNNVYFCRTRDLRNSLILMLRNPNAFPQHSEHGLSRAMRYWTESGLPFAILNPEYIRCFHMGTKVGEEDKLDQPLNSD